MPLGYSVLGLGVKEHVADTQGMVAAQLEQALPVLIHLPYSKLTNPGWPGVVISTHSGVDVTRDKQRFRDSVNGSVKVVVELVLDFRTQNIGL